ncbi:MAG: DUF3096 domain-containing protein [Chlamydiae bacterium]|nr:DUF3096 domain-containing protein [Chlamydiota bacterium]
MMIHPMANYVISLIAGVLILVFPTILNYIVALYLILIGLVGILSRVG